MKVQFSGLFVVILLLFSAGCLGDPIEDEPTEVNEIELELCEDDSASNFNHTGPLSINRQQYFPGHEKASRFWLYRS